MHRKNYFHDPSDLIYRNISYLIFKTNTMLTASEKTPDNEFDKLSNESDQLLSERYKLQKKIKALNETLHDSMMKMSVLEYEVKIKSILKDQLEHTTTSDQIQIDSLLNDLMANHGEPVEERNVTIDVKNSLILELHDGAKTVFERNVEIQDEMKALIEKFKTADQGQLLETLEKEKHDFISELSDEIKILREKIKNRVDANADVRVERDTLKTQLESVIDKIDKLVGKK